MSQKYCPKFLTQSQTRASEESKESMTPGIQTAEWKSNLHF